MRACRSTAEQETARVSKTRAPVNRGRCSRLALRPHTLLLLLRRARCHAICIAYNALPVDCRPSCIFRRLWGVHWISKPTLGVCVWDYDASLFGTVAAHDSSPGLPPACAVCAPVVSQSAVLGPVTLSLKTCVSLSDRRCSKISTRGLDSPPSAHSRCGAHHCSPPLPPCAPFSLCPACQ